MMSWSGSTTLAGFAREIAAWPGYVDPKQEAVKLVQQIADGTLMATEAWTDGRHAADDKYAELDYELAVALANVTEGAARLTVLKVTQVELSRGFVAWQRLTAWSLEVDGYEHHFKVIDEAQKIFVVREMMPKDIKREFWTGPRKFDEIVEKLEIIIINEMMADDGPVPMDLGNVVSHDTKMTQGDSDTSNDMSYEDVCAIVGKGTRPAREQAKRDRASWRRS